MDKLDTAPMGPSGGQIQDEMRRKEKEVNNELCVVCACVRLSVIQCITMYNYDSCIL